MKLLKVAPQLVVPDVIKTAEFYRDELGFKILGYFAEPPVYAMVARDDVEIHFGKGDTEQVQRNEAVRKGVGSDVYVWVDDIDELYRELSDRDVDIVEGPVKRIYNCTEVTIRDINGFLIVFGS